MKKDVLSLLAGAAIGAGTVYLVMNKMEQDKIEQLNNEIKELKVRIKKQVEQLEEGAAKIEELENREPEVRVEVKEVPVEAPVDNKAIEKLNMKKSKEIDYLCSEDIINVYGFLIERDEADAEAFVDALKLAVSKITFAESKKEIKKARDEFDSLMFVFGEKYGDENDDDGPDHYAEFLNTMDNDMDNHSEVSYEDAVGNIPLPDDLDTVTEEELNGILTEEEPAQVIESNPNRKKRYVKKKRKTRHLDYSDTFPDYPNAVSKRSFNFSAPIDERMTYKIPKDKIDKIMSELGGESDGGGITDEAISVARETNHNNSSRAERIGDSGRDVSEAGTGSTHKSNHSRKKKGDAETDKSVSGNGETKSADTRSASEYMKESLRSAPYTKYGVEDLDPNVWETGVMSKDMTEYYEGGDHVENDRYREIYYYTLCNALPDPHDQHKYKMIYILNELDNSPRRAEILERLEGINDALFKGTDMNVFDEIDAIFGMVSK